ncbi:MAG TPA: hypothetical protein DDZ88_14495 [Verrucomicrobiales bacterium]|nr:hypothetical protein [Verrucomicrobiales bacterium]
MKTKLTLLAATLLVGFSSASVIANPWKGLPPSFAPKASAAAKPVFKSCCDTKTSYSTVPSGRGLQANKSIVCNTGCAAPHAGKNCNAAERKQCAN